MRATAQRFRPAIVFPTLSPRLLAVIGLVAANVIWGTTFVATKPMLDRIPPITVSSARFAVALLVLLPLLYATGRRPILNRSTALMGFFGVFVAYSLQNLGLSFTGATNSAIIHGGIPVFTMLLAIPMLGERVGVGRVVGIGMSLVGVAAVVLRASDGTSGISALGDGFVLLSAVGLAAYFVLSRRMFSGKSSIELVGGVAVFGLLFLIPVSAAELWVEGMTQPTSGDVLRIVYLGAAASALAFVLWSFGLRHLEAGQAASFANLSPLVGVAFAPLLLGESISPIQIGGGLLILVGVWMANRRSGAHPVVAMPPSPSVAPKSPRAAKAAV